MKATIASLALTLAATAAAQNPIINEMFTADPTARVFNGRLYLYPSHDIPAPDDYPRKDWFCMADYHVFSSANLTDWTHHGLILTQNKIPWVEKNSYTMWAPDCVEKDGTYYFYFPAQPQGQRGFGIGVATASNPEGPFRPMWKPIEDVNGIDPCVLVDDGQAYIYWSGMGIRVAKLNDDMRSIDGEPMLCEGLPEGFKEGPFAFKRKGKYYLTFPWVRGKKGEPGPDGKPLDNHTETLAYAMSDSPTGPFEFKGVIMDEWANLCWTNHHSIVEYNGEWLLFYHHNDYSPKFDKNRSACVDYLHFNPDGTIRKVVPTLRGVGISDARRRIDIDRYSRISRNGASIDYLDKNDCFEGWKTILNGRNGWVEYDKVDFGSKPVKQVKVRARSRRGATLSVSLAGKNTVIAEVEIPRGSNWTEVTAPVIIAPEGVNNLRVALGKGAEAEIDWIGFDAVPWSKGAFVTGRYRNLFAEMGYQQEQIDARLQEVFNGVFYGKDKVYFEVGDSMAYISDIKNNDVRTEGMSYGMMIAVQMGKKDIFDRLWRWSKKYMQMQDGPMKGYFAWSCKTDGTKNAHGAASDGELYFITSLIFASNLWGNATGIDYLAEAQHILDMAMQKAGMDNAAPLINLEHRMITFTPDNWGGRFTDPSYHVPAFYEVWAQWANDGRAGFWKDCAKRSREYLHKVVNPLTGLTPDYSNYDGSLLGSRGVLGDAFRYDSWRVPMNIALDYSWSCADRDWQNSYADLLQGFLRKEGVDEFLDQYNVDGTLPERILEAGGYEKLRHSVGFVATAATASLAATDARTKEFVDALWQSKHEPYEDGYFDAYYDGLLRLFAFMHLSGNYRIIEPTNQ